MNSVGEIYVLSRNAAHPLTIWDADGIFPRFLGEGGYSPLLCMGSTLLQMIPCG